jgi:hypothetical protein
VDDINSSTQIRPDHTFPLAQITLTYRLDGVSQEFNETFSIEFDLTPNNHSFFPDRSVFSSVAIEQFNGIIIDRDSELRDYLLFK